jgi:hypothetical protein
MDDRSGLSLLTGGIGFVIGLLLMASLKNCDGPIDCRQVSAKAAFYTELAKTNCNKKEIKEVCE